MSPLFFISRSKPLSPFFVELHWPAAHFLFFSVFLLLYLPNCGHDNLSKLNTSDNTVQKQFPLSVFFFIDSFVVSAYKTPVTIHAISCQNNLELHLGYHTCWLSYFTLVYLWCGRTVGRAVCRCTVKWLPNFLGWVDYFIFFTHGALLASFARESSALSIQSTPDNSNLQGKSKKVRVIGSSEKIAGSKEKIVFTA